MATLVWRVLTVVAFFLIAANQLRTALPAAGEQSPSPPPPRVSARDEDEDDIFACDQYFYNQRAAPGTVVPDFALLRARQQVSQELDRAGAQALVESPWTS